MTLNKLELKLEQTLSRKAMISIAETFWQLPSVVDCIFQLSFTVNVKGLRKNQPINYKIWETVTDKVLEKTESLPLPDKVKTELNEIIVFTGERIRMSYIHRTISQSSKLRVLYSIKHSFVGTMRKYSVTNYNYCKLLELFWKDTLYNFFDSLCRRNLTVDGVSYYKNNIISYLDYLQPGLEASIKSKEDVVFNIICVWNYLYEKKYVPQEYLQNLDYIIPLEQIVKIRKVRALNYKSFPANYFMLKLSSLDISDLSYHFLYKSLKQIDKLLCPIFGYNIVDSFLLSINALSPDEVLSFFENLVNEIILFLLPLWPYQELVPQILDFSFENELNLDYEFLLEFLTYRIGVENYKKYKTINKNIYLRSFEKIWSKAPKSEQWTFLTSKIEVLSSLKLTLNENTINEIDLENIDIEFLTDFISKSVISHGDFKKFYKYCTKNVEFYSCVINIGTRKYFAMTSPFNYKSVINCSPNKEPKFNRKIRPKNVRCPYRPTQESLEIEILASV